MKKALLLLLTSLSLSAVECPVPYNSEPDKSKAMGACSTDSSPLTLKTMTETLTIERNETASIRDSTLSLMPEGLLQALPPEQARDLIAYLMHKSQVPLLATEESGSH